MIPNWLFAALSWLVLLGAMMTLAAVSREVYQRHFQPDAAQRFIFGSSPATASSGRTDLGQVAKAHIFGVVPPVAEPVVQKPKPVEAPKTRLKLLLTGVITGATPDTGRAMIEIKRGETGVVRVGEEIGQTGAILTAVYKDHILIAHRGKPEKLEIVRPEMALTNLRSQNDNTVKVLNINVSEFEALARVDPADVDISKLLPKRTQPPAQEVKPGNTDEIEEMTAQQVEDLERLERDEEIRELTRLLNDGGLEPDEIAEIKTELQRLQ